MEFLDGFSGTNGINPCSPMLMAAAGVVSGAGAEWGAYLGDGTPSQDATCDAGEGEKCLYECQRVLIADRV